MDYFSESGGRSDTARRGSEEIQESQETQLQEDRQGQLQRSAEPGCADGTARREDRAQRQEVARVVKNIIYCVKCKREGRSLHSVCIPYVYSSSIMLNHVMRFSGIK